MGVELSSWCETLRQHPKKMRYEGIDGFGEDPRVLATEDEQFMNKYVEAETDHSLDELERQIDENKPDFQHADYAQFLRVNYAMDWDGDENVKDASDEAVIEALDDHDRQVEWACESVEPSDCWETIKEDDLEYFLKAHPPIEIWDHASECGVPLADVYFMCPGCARQPVQRCDCRHGRFYCGLCGAESLASSSKEFFESLGVEIYPFKDKLTMRDIARILKDFEVTLERQVTTDGRVVHRCLSGEKSVPPDPDDRPDTKKIIQTWSTWQVMFPELAKRAK